jgi:mRNA interferase MazF
MIYDPFDVVVVPFPFTDTSLTVKRPALVVSTRAFNSRGHTVLVMITDQRNSLWPLDVAIEYQAVGLKMASVVRMKFFTLDNRLISRRIGKLSTSDQRRVIESLRGLLPGQEQE